MITRVVVVVGHRTPAVPQAQAAMAAAALDLTETPLHLQPMERPTQAAAAAAVVSTLAAVARVLTAAAAL